MFSEPNIEKYPAILVYIVHFNHFYQVSTISTRYFIVFTISTSIYPISTNGRVLVEIRTFLPRRNPTLPLGKNIQEKSLKTFACNLYSTRSSALKFSFPLGAMLTKTKIKNR